MIKLKEGFQENIYTIFDLVKNKKLNHYTTPSEMRKLAEDYIISKEIKREDLVGFSFFDFDNFEADKDNVTFEFMCTCARLGSIIDALLTPEKEEIDFGKLTRKISPPLEAYKYTAFNKMDIKPSGRSYGLTFE